MESLAQAMVIIVNPNPTLAIVGNDPLVCNGTDGTIDLTGNSLGNVTIEWSGAATGTQTATLPYIITGIASGTYDVFYTDDVTGCVSMIEQVILNNPGAPIIDPITPYISCEVDYIVPAITAGANLSGDQAVYDAPGGPNGGGSLVPTGTAISVSTTLYAYDESGICSNEAVISITINPLPNSGTNGAITYCSVDAPEDLFNHLGGSPDLGGTWSPALNSGTGVFDPAADAQGTYTYSVTNGCGTSSTDVAVTITANPTAGTDGAVTLCDTDPSVDLFSVLGGNPDLGGTWSPALSSGTGVYNPSTDAGGIYTYTITTSCGSFSANVDVTLNVSDDATFSYSSDIFCLNAANPIASINVTNGGVFTISLGGEINATNGTIDLAGSGPGTYGVTYSTAGPCADVFVLTITILDVTDPIITPVGPFCSDNSPVILQASQSGGVWSGIGVNPVTGEFNPSLAISGLNDITYTIDGLCIAFSTIQIEVIPVPIVSTIEDTTIMNGNSVNLITTGNVSAYSWSPGATLICDDCQNPVATPDVTTTYTVSVEENGCVATDQVTITIDYEIIIYVPNAFTPNGDGQNDVFFPVISGIDSDEYKFMIFNRWGELIFNTSHLSEGWDGTYKGLMSQQDVYVWKIYCKEISSIETHEYIGHVTLIK
jgi:gliding motility-associated-like protein